MDQDLARAVTELRDRDQIRELLSRYCRGVDRLDPDIIRSCYHPDAHDDHGPFKGGPEEFIAWVVPTLKGELFSLHHLTSQTIRLDGEVAHSETYFIAVHDQAQGDKARRMTAHGRYVDRLEKRQGEWRIALRRTVIEALTYTEAPFSGRRENAGFILGTHDRSDVSYALA